MMKKTFLFFEMVVRIWCPVKLELTVFAGKNATCAVFKCNMRRLIERACADDYIRHLLVVIK